MAELRNAPSPDVTGAQIKAARALVGWSHAQQLADAARVSLVTVRRFEEGGRGSNLAKMSMVEALQEAGVVFFDRGVALRSAADDEAKGEE